MLYASLDLTCRFLVHSRAIAWLSLSLVCEQCANSQPPGDSRERSSSISSTNYRLVSFSRGLASKKPRDRIPFCPLFSKPWSIQNDFLLKRGGSRRKQPPLTFT